MCAGVVDPAHAPRGRPRPPRRQVAGGHRAARSSPRAQEDRRTRAPGRRAARRRHRRRAPGRSRGSRRRAPRSRAPARAARCSAARPAARSHAQGLRLLRPGDRRADRDDRLHDVERPAARAQPEAAAQRRGVRIEGQLLRTWPCTPTATPPITTKRGSDAASACRSAPRLGVDAAEPGRRAASRCSARPRAGASRACGRGPRPRGA